MRFYTPYKRTVLIQCDSLPIGIGSFGGIEGIVIGLIKVGPVILAYPQLNISRLTAGFGIPAPVVKDSSTYVSVKDV